MLHWNMEQKTEISSYSKCRIRLQIDSKQIFNELCGIYGPQTIPMRTVFRWVKAIKAIKAGKFSVEDDTRPGRPGISEGSVQTILKKRLDPRKVCASWVPHLLTEEQKTQRLKCARELLKTYKGCNSRVISNLLTDDETWVHMFEPQRRADNKQWKRKDKKNAYVLPREPYVRKRCCAQFSLIQVGQSFKYLVHLFIQSLADSTRILY